MTPTIRANPRTSDRRSRWVRAHQISAKAPSPTSAIGAAVAFMNR